MVADKNRKFPRFSVVLKKAAFCKMTVCRIGTQPIRKE